ncbi:MAG TPA: YceH family protein [Planctomycetota bacterium]|nr:YceH family protein [Planctomycetota bacterium]
MTDIQLEPLEARVLGVLIEKALTTPEQYPLSLNGLTAGCNQKNNRDPVLSVSEREVADAILRLRVAGLVEFVQLTGQRVEKYRHNADAHLQLQPAEVAVLAELLLRGPQQAGELRGRVERMHAMPDLQALQLVLDALAVKGLVVRLERRSGERASRYAQTLCPAQGAAPPAGLGPAAASQAPVTANSPHETPGVANTPSSAGELAARVAALEAEVSTLRERLRALAARAGAALEAD